MRIVGYDNDGHKDLFFANNHVMDNIEKMQPHLQYLKPLLLLKQVDGKFVNVSAQSGKVFTEKWASRGAAFGGLDNDGDIDAAVETCGGRCNHRITLRSITSRGQISRSRTGNRRSIFSTSSQNALPPSRRHITQWDGWM